MKKIIFSAIIFILILSFNSYGQYLDQDAKYTSAYIHASAGTTKNYEWVFELETGVKAKNIPVFVSIPAMVYTAKTANNGNLHIYYGIRANYLINTSKRTAVGPIVTYFRHVSGEPGQRLQSNDWDAGARFYLFVREPGMTSVAWTLTAKYLHTQENNYLKEGSKFQPVNKFIVSVGLHGLF